MCVKKIFSHVTDDIWHMTYDRWQVTCDRSHMTRKCETWQMTHSVGWTFSQNCSSLALPVWDWQCLEDIWNKGWLNESINQWASEVILEQPWLHRIYVYNVHSLVRSVTKKFTWHLLRCTMEIIKIIVWMCWEAFCLMSAGWIFEQFLN